MRIAQYSPAALSLFHSALYVTFPDNGKRPDAGEASSRFLGKKKEKEKRGYQNREPRGQLPVWMVSVYGTNLNKVLIIQKNFENLFQMGVLGCHAAGRPPTKSSAGSRRPLPGTLMILGGRFEQVMKHSKRNWKHLLFFPDRVRTRRSVSAGCVSCLKKEKRGE